MRLVAVEARMCRSQKVRRAEDRSVALITVSMPPEAVSTMASGGVDRIFIVAGAAIETVGATRHQRVVAIAADQRVAPPNRRGVRLGVASQPVAEIVAEEEAPASKVDETAVLDIGARDGVAPSDPPGRGPRRPPRGSPRRRRRSS